MRGIVEFFFRQHLFGNLLSAVLIIFGIYSAITIRKDLFPNVQFDVTVISAVLPGASPDQVEKLLVNPLEASLREVDGVKKVQSNATDSRAVITITLDPDARSPEKTNDDIRRAVDQVEDYPEDAEKPVVTEIESGQTPLIELILFSSSLGELELRNLAKNISDELASVTGVAKVTKQAWRKREYRVHLQQNKLSANHISLSNVIDSLRVQSIQLPAGDFPLENGNEVSVKTDAEVNSLEKVLRNPVRSNFEGYGVQIKDLGDVEETLEKPSLVYRTNSEDAMNLLLIKKEKADALKTVKLIKERMNELAKGLPEGVQYQFVSNFSEYLENRIKTLTSNMLLGIFLVFAVLALFLPFRVAIVVSLGIPLSMLAAISTIQYLGFSINLISLIGLIIVSGMLVDDAIVVIDNVYRRVQEGLEFTNAIVIGTSEMIAPVTASVLTTVSAFGPMLFMTGIFGKFIFEIPVMVILPLMFSLIECFFIAPGHFLAIVGEKRALSMASSTSKNPAWYEWFIARYRRLIVFSLRHNLLSLLVFVLMLLTTGFLASKMRFVLFPPDGVYTFFIRVDAEPGTPLKKMVEIMKTIEPYLDQLPKEELRDYTSMIGIQQNDAKDPFSKRASHYAQIRVNLSPENTRSRSVDTIVDDLRKKVPLPQGAIKIGFEVAKGGPPQGKPIAINIYGEDFAQLREIASAVKQKLGEIKGVSDIEDSEVIGKEEWRVLPDKQKLSQVGLSSLEVAQTVRAAFAGIVPTSVRTLDEEIDVRIQLKPDPSKGELQLKNLEVSNQRGDLIPLAKIASFDSAPSRLLIQHEKFKRIIGVNAQVNLEQVTAVEATKKAEAAMSEVMKKYPNYSVSYGGENEDTQESMLSLGRAFLVAIVLIFAILILTFNSFVQPFLVLFSIPLGFMGVVFALLTHGRPISFMAMLGIIALAGVIVNNAIVYIDFFNTRRKEGMSLEDALLDAATTRLRPIIMTSLTTVLGLMPTAYGIGGNDGFVMALALCLGWGMLFGSTLTVLIFPSLLLTTEKVRNWRFRN